MSAYKGSKNKVGLDDLIKKQGANQFENLISAAILPPETPISILEDFYKVSDKHDHLGRIKLALSTLDEVEYSSIRRDISKHFSIQVSILDKEIKKIRKSLPKRVCVEEICINEDRPVRKILDDIQDVLVKSGELFRYGKDLITFIGKKPFKVTHKSLPGFLNKMIELKKETENASFYSLLNEPMVRAIVFEPERFIQFPEIQIITDYPLLDENLKLSDVGYNSKSKIFLTESAISPTKLTHEETRRIFTDQNSNLLIGKLINEFCYKSNADRCNYLALFLDRFFPNLYMGLRPFAVFSGNQPGIGKTIAAQVLANLFQEAGERRVSYTSNDEEFEKRMGAQATKGDFLLIDNIKCKTLDSPFLEATITSQIFQSRRLGTSETIERPNTLSIMATMNDASLSRDLITRSIPINLYYPGDPTKRNFKNKDPLNFAKKNHNRIKSELLGMIQLWKELGKPVWHQENFRFSGWGGTVGGIIQACGGADFLKNIHDSNLDMNSDLKLIGELFDGNREKKQYAGQLVSRAEYIGLFEGKNLSTPKSKSTYLGKLLMSYSGRCVLVDGLSPQYEAVLKSEDKPGRGQSVYWLEIQTKTEFLSDKLTGSGGEGAKSSVSYLNQEGHKDIPRPPIKIENEKQFLSNLSESNVGVRSPEVEEHRIAIEDKK